MAVDLSPRLTPASREFDPARELKVDLVKDPVSRSTLGDLGIAARVTGPAEFPLTLLVMPFEARQLDGIEAMTVRVFRLDEKSRELRAVWNSGINVTDRFVWTKIRRGGVYVAIGLPRDRLLQETIRVLAERRRAADDPSAKELEALAREAFAPFIEAPEDELEQLRAVIATAEAKTALGGVQKEELRYAEGGHFAGFALPRGTSIRDLRERLRRLEIGPKGLPEEQLFYPPEVDSHHGGPPWPVHHTSLPWPGLSSIVKFVPSVFKILPRFPYCWFWARNWWMYHANERHTGAAAGCSDIRSTTAQYLKLQSEIDVADSVVTIPTIVDGKIYIGTGGYNTTNATLYKIDIATGTVEGRFPVSGNAYYSYNGIGGSPAVVGGRVYFTAVHGKVYCVDAATMTPSPPHPPALWVVDLKSADAAHNQPVTNPNGDCWSSPLVVNGNVYVGTGEGESWGTYSFAYCLDANTGNVRWLYCLNQFVPNPNPAGTHNAPNVLPQSTVGITPLPAPFTTHPTVANPPHAGASPWSSFGFDAVLDRVYVGTGNSQPDNPLPDEWYASGMISLDATTGDFKGFFQPAQADSYRAGDLDVDVPGAATVFQRGADRVIGLGSKNGSYFLLDASTMQVLGGGAQRRQLLPRHATTGGALPTVDPWAAGGQTQGENKWGVMGTAALHAGLGRLFVGLGGYMGIDDHQVTPFVRALDWNTLADAWPTQVDTVNGNPVVRYTNGRPPLYATAGEGGLSSPAVVNDVVFVSTSKTGLYAFDASTGHTLWQAPSMPAGGWPNFSLGPAIYGNWVVVGAATKVLIYYLAWRWCPPWWWKWWWFEPYPWPIYPVPIGPLPVPPVPPGPRPGPPPPFEIPPALGR